MAKLHLEAIFGSRTPREVRETIQRLPAGSQGLGETYGKALDRINAKPTELKRRLHHMLEWLVYARRPLRPAELQHALAVNMTGEELDSDDFTSTMLGCTA